jgi:hypothetical protein
MFPSLLRRERFPRRREYTARTLHRQAVRRPAEYDRRSKEVRVETKMIAFCGLTCTECPGYLATQSGDEEELKKVAAQWSDEYGGELSVDDVRCNGCLATTGPWMSHCSECKIRACGVEKGLESCANCDDYACEKLTEFFGFVPEAKVTLDGLRAAR